MRKVIVTGFESFGPYKYNPTHDVAREYDGKIIGNAKITGLVLPCTYYGAFDALSKRINELSPDAIVSSGLASRVSCIQLEVVGRNIMQGKYPDAEGRNPSGEQIVKRGKSEYKTNSSFVGIARSLNEAGIQNSVSLNAESFVCNSLLYLTARRIFEEGLPINFTFFHTPWTNDYLDRVTLEAGKVSISKNDLRKTIEVLVEESRNLL